MKALLLSIALLSVACGLQARPRPPVVNAPVYALRVESRAGSAVLSWRGRAEDHATTYQVQRRERGPDSEGSPPFGSLLVNMNVVGPDSRDSVRFDPVGSIEVQAGNFYEFVDENLVAGHRYTYRVRTMPRPDRSSSVFRGPEISMTWEEPPAAPTKVTSIPVDGGVRLEWEPVADATGYRVYRRLADETSVRAHFAVLDVTKFTDLSAGAQDAQFVVRSVRLRETGVPRELEGPSSQVGETEKIDVLAPPPVDVVAVKGSSEVSLSWRKPKSVTSLRFHVYRSGERLTSEAIDETTFVDSNPVPTSTYTVVSVDPVGREGPPSEPVRVN